MFPSTTNYSNVLQRLTPAAQAIIIAGKSLKEILELSPTNAGKAINTAIAALNIVVPDTLYSRVTTLLAAGALSALDSWVAQPAADDNPVAANGAGRGRGGGVPRNPRGAAALRAKKIADDLAAAAAAAAAAAEALARDANNNPPPPPPPGAGEVNAPAVPGGADLNQHAAALAALTAAGERAIVELAKAQEAADKMAAEAEAEEAAQAVVDVTRLERREKKARRKSKQAAEDAEERRYRRAERETEKEKRRRKKDQRRRKDNKRRREESSGDSSNSTTSGSTSEDEDWANLGAASVASSGRLDVYQKVRGLVFVCCIDL
jgi:hypothetical protein